MTRKQRWIAALGLVLAVGVFSTVRIAKSRLRLWDLNMYAAMADAWLEGRNPYDEAALRAEWNNGSGKMDLGPQRAIAPPTTLVLIAPLTRLPLQATFVTWTLIAVALTLTAIAILWRTCGWSWHEPRALFTLACVLASGPFILGISVGQPSLPAVSLIVLSSYFLRRQQELSGVLLALATALKLQLGAPVLLYFLLRRQWRVSLWAMASFSLITTIALVRMQSGGVVWLNDWVYNIRDSSTGGGPNDFTTGNKTRDHLLNLQLPLYAITIRRKAAGILAWSVTAILGALYLPRLWRRQEHPLLDLSFVLAAMLLPLYHRYYDAIVLMVALAWALRALDEPNQRHLARAVLAVMALFLLPVGWAMNLVSRGYVQPSMTSSTWWNALVASEQSWALLVLSILLLVATKRESRQRVDSAPPAATVTA